MHMRQASHDVPAISGYLSPLCQFTQPVEGCTIKTFHSGTCSQTIQRHRHAVVRQKKGPTVTTGVAFDVKTFAMSTGPYSLNTRVFGGWAIIWVVQLLMAIFREQISYLQFHAADIMQWHHLLISSLPLVSTVIGWWLSSQHAINQLD